MWAKMWGPITRTPLRVREPPSVDHSKRSFEKHFPIRFFPGDEGRKTGNRSVFLATAILHRSTIEDAKTLRYYILKHP